MKNETAIFSEEVQHQLEENAKELKQNPQAEQGWLSRAKILAGAQRIDLAVDACSRGISYDTNSGELILARGHYYINLGRPQEAAADLSRARTLLGETWQVMYHLALAEYLCGNYTKAEALYRRMIELFPSDTAHIPLFNWLWACLVHQGRLEEAAEVAGSVQAEWDPADDAAYQRAQLFVAGKITLEEALGGDDIQYDVHSITTSYGVYNYYRYVKKDHEMADYLLSTILKRCEGDYRFCFANQAAKSEMVMAQGGWPEMTGEA